VSKIDFWRYRRMCAFFEETLCITTEPIRALSLILRAQLFDDRVHDAENDN
jgi:hypothetical protein